MIDRRVARTRSLLHRAHLALILEKGYEAVTVEDICVAANVGRSTFYAHYPNKEALHRGGLEHLRQELIGSRPEGVGPLAFSLPMFEHARERLDLYRALMGGRGGTMALEEIRQILSDIVRAELSSDTNLAQHAARKEFAVRYLVGAYLAVLTWWLDGGAKLPSAEMDAMFRRLANDGLQSIKNLRDET